MVLRKYKISEYEGETIIHAGGIIGGDLTLCGLSSSGAIEVDTPEDFDDCGQFTDEKINCPDCISIIRYCKKITRKDYDWSIKTYEDLK